MKIPLILNRVYADEVKSYLRDPVGIQLFFPKYKNAVATNKDKDHKIKPNPGTSSFNVRCEVYVDKDPLIKIYTEDGIFLDAATLSRIDHDPCTESSLNNYIVPKTPQNGQIVMQYLIAKENPECEHRFYEVEKLHMMASVTRSGSYPVPCSSSVNQFLQTFNDRRKAGGILDITKNGQHQVMDYIENVKKKGDTVETVFPAKDFIEKSFTMNCRKDVLTTGEEFTTGAIVHEDSNEIILDRFEMGICNFEYINVNRQIFNSFDHYKTAFKTLEGKCYERQYEYSVEKPISFYSQLEVRRKDPVDLTTCPPTFVGDIDDNAYNHPWYLGIARFCCPFLAPYPYSHEVKLTPFD